MLTLHSIKLVLAAFLQRLLRSGVPLFFLAGLLAILVSACGSQNMPGSLGRPDPEAGSAASPPTLPLLFYLAADAPVVYGRGNFSLRDTVESAMRTWNDAAGMPLFSLAKQRSDKVSSKFDPRESLFDNQNVFYVFRGGSQASFDVLPESRTKDILGVCFRQNDGADIAVTLVPEHTALDATDIVASPNETRAFDLQSVVVHEFGHALGFGHDVYNPTSVMWANGLEVGAVNRRLSASDKQVLLRIMKERFNTRIFVNNVDDPEPPLLQSSPAS